MKTQILPATVAFALSIGAATGTDWHQWRGPNWTGIAAPDQNPPVRFSENENVDWVVPIPGRGHGSPTVYGTRIFLATADEKAKTQSLLCLARDSGKLIWKRTVHEGGFPRRSNKKASHASSTPACDGNRVFINFLHAGAVYTTAFDLEGKQLWQQRITDYVLHQGFSTSPTVYKSLVIVSADNKGGGAICAMKRETGDIVWRVERPEFPNYTSPIVHKIGGRDQLIFQGCNLVSSFDPMTGSKLWEHEGATTECVSSIVTDGERVFSSGGFDRNHVAAMKADGSGEVEWENISRVYVPSMFVHEGHLYAVMDSGIAVCWKADTGELKWKERLIRTTSASPVLVGKHVYAADENGQFFVFKADPEKFEIVAKNRLGNQIYATPTICGGKIYARVAFLDGDRRQEKLFCLGTKK